MKTANLLIRGIGKVVPAVQLIVFVCLISLVVGCATGASPLHRAAEAGDIEKVKVLVEKGADVNQLQ